MAMTYAEHAEGAFREWFRRRRKDVDALVFDVDGVLMIKGDPMPGAEELLATIRADGIPFTLLTNDGCSSPEEKCAKLAASGLHIDPDELVSCGHGLEELVRQRQWAGEPAYVMGRLGEPSYAERAGLVEITDLSRIHECRAAIIGENTFDWQHAIEGTFNALVKQPDFPLIVPNPDSYFPGRNGRLHIGSGALGRFLEALCRAYGLDMTPEYLGKPYSPILQYAHHRLEHRAGHPIERDRVMLVGDSIASDIAGGRRFGYRTALVLTGITRPEMPATDESSPEFVFHTL
ncbi:MAG: HAD-IIA family hydrolase [Verrucomicrobiota bacterium]